MSRSAHLFLRLWSKLSVHCIGLFLFLVSYSHVIAQEIVVPAHTAYLEPDAGGARVTADVGVTEWSDPVTSIVWFGDLKHTGTVQVRVQLRLASAVTSQLRLTLANESRSVAATGNADNVAIADFGEFDIKESGYHSIRLQSDQDDEPPKCDVQSLILAGTPVVDAHFNLKPRRNAASVHLAYPLPPDAKVSAFYCEMTGLEDPMWTYYMACGWHRGYFGMQVNSPTERRIIFSVWDSGNEAVDRNKVADDNRVRLVEKGDGVYTGDFGNEGTGGHSHLKYWWKTGETQKFLVTAEPIDDSHTVYSGYYFHPDSRQWMLISSWKAPKEGRYMRGLYSFSENFAGRNGHLVRKALFGNQWIRFANGKWQEITTATFSHDATGKADRLDRFMGLQDDQFFLSHGGFVDGFTKFGTPFERPSTGRTPDKMPLPSLPPPVE